MCENWLTGWYPKCDSHTVGGRRAVTSSQSADDLPTPVCLPTIWCVAPAAAYPPPSHAHAAPSRHPWGYGPCASPPLARARVCQRLHHHARLARAKLYFGLFGRPCPATTATAVVVVDAFLAVCGARADAAMCVCVIISLDRAPRVITFIASYLNAARDAFYSHFNFNRTAFNCILCNLLKN